MAVAQVLQPLHCCWENKALKYRNIKILLNISTIFSDSESNDSKENFFSLFYYLKIQTPCNFFYNKESVKW